LNADANDDIAKDSAHTTVNTEDRQFNLARESHETLEVNTMSESAQSKSATTKAKRRGRPPKAVISDMKKAATPKRRGRPPKAPTAAATKKAATTTAKSRGRSPKASALASSVNPTTTTAKRDRPAKATKKPSTTAEKRGRPAKATASSAAGQLAMTGDIPDLEQISMLRDEIVAIDAVLDEKKEQLQNMLKERASALEAFMIKEKEAMNQMSIDNLKSPSTKAASKYTNASKSNATLGKAAPDKTTKRRGRPPKAALANSAQD
jgi:hypothetical protein